MKADGTKAIVAAFAANLGIALAKLVAFTFTGAASMLAEAVHSLADTSNQGLLILGGRLARRAEDKGHPFGHGRERYFWAFVVALVIFTMGAAFAVYEGIEKLLEPHEIESPMWAVGTLSVAIVLESLSLRTAVREARHIKGRRSWWRFIHDSKVPELPVVLLEDTGALVGLALALVGVGLAAWTGDARFDALGSLAIGVLLAVIAGILAMETRSLLLGESANPQTIRDIEDAVKRQEPVVRLIHMRTEHLGPEELLVACKVEFRPDLDTAGLARAIDAVEAAMRAAVPIARIIYVEPDITDPSRLPS